MPIGEPHALRSELVDVWRGNLTTLGVVALHIAVAEVVGENVENIWFGGGGFLSVSDGREKPDKGEIDE